MPNYTIDKRSHHAYGIPNLLIFCAGANSSAMKLFKISITQWYFEIEVSRIRFASHKVQIYYLRIKTILTPYTNRIYNSSLQFNARNLSLGPTKVWDWSVWYGGQISWSVCCSASDIVSSAFELNFRFDVLFFVTVTLSIYKVIHT